MTNENIHLRAANSRLSNRDQTNFLMVLLVLAVVVALAPSAFAKGTGKGKRVEIREKTQIVRMDPIGGGSTRAAMGSTMINQALSQALSERAKSQSVYESHSTRKAANIATKSKVSVELGDELGSVSRKNSIRDVITSERATVPRADTEMIERRLDDESRAARTQINRERRERLESW